MSHRTASHARLQRGLRATHHVIRELRGQVAKLERAQRSEAPGDEATSIRPHRKTVAVASSPASPNNPGGAVVQSPGVRYRDPRLGRYANVGAFLMACDRQLRLPKPQVYRVAGLMPGDDALQLLAYEGGLNALFAACQAHTREGARA